MRKSLLEALEDLDDNSCQLLTAVKGPLYIFLCYFRGEYYINETTGYVTVCLMGFLNGRFGSTVFASVDIYLSFILNLVSVFTVAATLVTYFLFKDLRNLPGLNLMCLAASIFVSRVTHHHQHST